MNFENKQKNAYEDYIAKAKEVNYAERKNCLELAINTLIRTEDPAERENGYPFLGSIMQCMNLSYSEAIPTAGVMYNNKTKKFEMLINPYFFCRTLTPVERTAVLLHEMYHITFKHVYYDVPENYNRIQLNFAMDLVINQFIKGLPQQALFIEKFRMKDGTPFGPNKTTQAYYEMLMDAEMKNSNYDPQAKPEKEGEGQSLMDPSKEWVDVQEMIKNKEAAEFDIHEWDGADAKEKMEALNDLIKRTMIKSSQSHSLAPRHIQDLLVDIETQLVKLNYKAILLSTLRKSMPAKNSRPTWKRPSRRYGDVAKGNITAKMPNIEVFVDTSGSISIEEANEFLKITNNFLTVGVGKCHLSLFHTEIYHTEKVKKGFKLEEKTFQSGGTDLTCIMERVIKIKPDLSIVITDGYYGDVNFNTKQLPQMVFIISKGGTLDHPLKRFGPSVKYAA